MRVVTIDAPGHRDVIKNMITGASQANVTLAMVPTDGNFTTAIARCSHKPGEIQWQTRQHSRLIKLGVNKMECDTDGYKKDRYDEIKNEMISMLVKVGWKKDFIEQNTPTLPISGWVEDNILKKSDKMAGWSDMDAGCKSGYMHANALYDVFNDFCRASTRSRVSAMSLRDG